MKDVGTIVMKSRIAPLFKWMGKYTLPVYLMQFVFWDLVEIKTNIDQTTMLYRLGAPFVFIPSIVFITWCLRKIPVVKEIVP